MDEWGYSAHEIERITRLSAEIALRHNPPWPVISLDKANVLASSRLWRRVVEKTMTTEYPQVKLVHQLADSASLILATNPRALNGVILADNTFGDMISDQAGSIVGTLGVLPSASLDGLPSETRKRTNGLYEPTHGSAPTYVSLCPLFPSFTMKQADNPQNRRPEHRQPRRHDPLRGTHVPLFARHGDRGAADRKGSSECSGCWDPHP
jgi:isocitrate dehydrogenase